MQEHTIHLQFSSLPPVFKRKQHVLILLRNASGHYVLGRKHHYPEGMSRLVGGGMNDLEEPHRAAARELHEETGLSVSPDELTEICKVIAQISSPEGEVSFITYLYFYDVGNRTLVPSDDLDGLAELDHEQAEHLLSTYAHLPTAMHPQLKFAWSDYGQLYGFIHKLAFDAADKIPL